MSKKTITLIVVIVLIAVGGVYYWFFVRNPSPDITTPANSPENGGFSVFGNNPTANSSGNSSVANTPSTSDENTQAPASVPMLRELSTTPVGGMAASTTASSTIVRWIDRGVGRVYQAYSNDPAIDELSNTTIPQVYSTYWNNSATSFILQSIADGSDAVTNFYATLFPIPVAIDGSGSSTPYELRGSPLPSDTLAIAVSPKGDQIFSLENSTDGGTGYVSQFNGTKKTKIFSTPLTELNIEWPEQNTIAITTKGSSEASGFLYFVNPKDGIFNKIVGNIPGLSTLTSKDASQVLYTASVANGIKTSLYNVKTGVNQDILFNTMPEKCVWSAIQKNILYCAVPSTIPSGNYPDDWYKGNISFSDSIWEVNTTTGDTHEVADLLKISGTVIDATNLVLDPQENYLYFINKKDLTLWSLELNG